MGEQILRQAEDLLQKTDVRTLDALHIASAVMFQAASGLTTPFITSDAAQDTGLTIIWVE